MKPNPTHAPKWIQDLTKGDLHSLISDTTGGDEAAVSRSVEFFIHESFGLWHNRARSKLCRGFKKRPPSLRYCQLMVDTICTRLLSGQFYEQFWEQLSMAIRFDRERMAEAAADALQSDREYIRRYARRILHAIDSIPDSENAG